MELVSGSGIKYLGFSRKFIIESTATSFDKIGFQIKKRGSASTHIVTQDFNPGAKKERF